MQILIVIIGFGNFEIVIADCLERNDGFRNGKPSRMSIRSEERRVGKECAMECISRWSPYH